MRVMMKKQRGGGRSPPGGAGPQHINNNHNHIQNQQIYEQEEANDDEEKEIAEHDMEPSADSLMAMLEHDENSNPRVQGRMTGIRRARDDAKNEDDSVDQNEPVKKRRKSFNRPRSILRDSNHERSRKRTSARLQQHRQWKGDGSDIEGDSDTDIDENRSYHPDNRSPRKPLQTQQAKQNRLKEESDIDVEDSDIDERDSTPYNTEDEQEKEQLEIQSEDEEDVDENKFELRHIL